MRKLPLPTYSSVVATLALFISLGGATYAATSLPRDSVGSAQIKNGAVTLAKLAKPARKKLSALHIVIGSAGATGVAGAQGPRGEQGPAGTAEAGLKEAVTKQAKEIEQLNANVEHLSTQVTDDESSVSVLEVGLGNVQNTAKAAEQAAVAAEKQAGEASGGVSALESGLSSVQVTAKAADEAAVAAGKTAGEANSGLTTLTSKVNSQCSSIDEVVSHANKLTSGVSELTTALNLVLGSFTPKLPESSKSLSC